MSEQVVAPWSRNQVASLNAYQAMGRMHPFTCARRGNGAHRHLWGDVGTLIADSDGWLCLDCDYIQDWAHAFMADWSWNRPDGSMMHAIFSTGRPTAT